MGRRLGAGETIAVSLVGSGALVAIPLTLVTLVASGVSIASSAVLRVNDLAIAPGGEYPPVLTGSDAVVDAGFETAWAEVANLPAGVRWLLWTEGALPALTGLVIAIATLWLARALLRGSPFTRALPGVLVAVAIVVIVGGLSSQVIGALARAETVLFLGPAEEMTGPGGFTGFWFALDFGPIGWGVGIALVAAAFRIGTRLQRETAGLV
ncbi:DUF2975 domain-containing protein [Microbacterium sp. P04]|uniref:DUF2975 domain-containing protein n=1 Tax=Microbacterium sp. P04 TaxID=3366947 RepID=UPI003744BEDB